MTMTIGTTVRANTLTLTTGVIVALEGDRIRVRHNELMIDGKPYESLENPACWTAVSAAPGMKNTIEILPRSFATALKSVAYAMSTDAKTRLNRILVECTGRELVLVATDGQRLAKAAIPLVEEHDVWSASIPGTNVPAIIKAVSKTKYMLAVSKRGIESQSPADQFEFDTAEMFPPYAQVIPQHSEVSVEYAESVELTTITGALKTANKRQYGTVHSVGNELRFSADVNSSTAIRANVGCGQINGTIRLTGFCLAYLHDAAKSLKGFAASLQWSGELDPLVIRSRVDTIDLTAVVMPVRI